jgi:hypothetical protein
MVLSLEFEGIYGKGFGAYYYDIVYDLPLPKEVFIHTGEPLRININAIIIFSHR